MADNPLNWSAYGQTKTAINSAAELKNMTADAIVTCATAIDNTAGSTLWDLELLIDLATAASAGGYVALWWLRSVDGTNYETIETAVPARAPDVIIPVRVTTTDSQVATVGMVPMPQGLFKVIFQNKTGQTTTNTDSLTMLYYRSYNPVIVTA